MSLRKENRSRGCQPREQHPKQDGKKDSRYADAQIRAQKICALQRTRVRLRLLLSHLLCASQDKPLGAIGAPRNIRGGRRLHATPLQAVRPGWPCCPARVAKPCPVVVPYLHPCRAAPEGSRRLTLRSGPSLPAGGRASRPIKAAAPRPHFPGGAGRTRSPPHGEEVSRRELLS